MSALRAYLILCAAGEWSVSVHKEINSLTAAWKDISSVEGVVGIVHLGFERPPTREFVDLALRFPGKVLLTPSAKYGLPY